MDSGSYLEDNQNSILEFEDFWVRNGSIRFNWRVNGEPTYDGMTFYIDGAEAIPFTSTHFSGYSSFSVGAGSHKLKFVYSKDYSVSVGDDKAFLYELILEGIDYADSECVPCAPGKFNNITAQDQCTVCPFGYYSDQYGASSCKPCASNSYAFEGSSSCTARVACTENDYEMRTTPCRPGVLMDYIYNWKSPKICDDTNFNLPANVYNVTCFDCQPGQFRPQGDYICRNCNPGTYLTSQNTCVECGQGSYAPRLSTHSRWDHWPS